MDYAFAAALFFTSGLPDDLLVLHPSLGTRFVPSFIALEDIASHIDMV